MKRSASALGFIFVFVLAGWTVFVRTESSSAKSQDAANQGANYSTRNIPLPDNNAGDVSMDYITYDPGTNSVWVPGGNTGAVDIVDVATGNELLLAGIPLERVSVLLGHQSVRITERHYNPWVRSRQEQLETDLRQAWSQDPVALLEEGTNEVHEKQERTN